MKTPFPCQPFKHCSSSSSSSNSLFSLNLVCGSTKSFIHKFNLPDRKDADHAIPAYTRRSCISFECHTLTIACPTVRVVSMGRKPPNESRVEVSRLEQCVGSAGPGCHINIFFSFCLFILARFFLLLRLTPACERDRWARTPCPRGRISYWHKSEGQAGLREVRDCARLLLLLNLHLTGMTWSVQNGTFERSCFDFIHKNLQSSIEFSAARRLPPSSMRWQS